jgi:hypothetical protein
VSRPCGPDELERRGIDPKGLSHGEAVALKGRLWGRGQRGEPSPRLLAAVAREEALADLPTDLRKLGRLDLAEARRRLERAMSAARWAVDPLRASAYEGTHG